MYCITNRTQLPLPDKCFTSVRYIPEEPEDETERVFVTIIEPKLGGECTFRGLVRLTAWRDILEDATQRFLHSNR